jgi:hypothetical protein
MMKDRIVRDTVHGAHLDERGAPAEPLQGGFEIVERELAIEGDPPGSRLGRKSWLEIVARWHDGVEKKVKIRVDFISADES